MIVVVDAQLEEMGILALATDLISFYLSNDDSSARKKKDPYQHDSLLVIPIDPAILIASLWNLDPGGSMSYSYHISI